MQNMKDKRRNSFRDMSILISIAIFIVMLIRSSMFGFSIVSITWLVLVMAYWCMVYIYTKKIVNGKMVKYGNIVFLSVSALLLVSSVLFDKNARPKMHAFEGAGEDSIASEEEFVVDETPDIVVMQPDTTIKDTVRTDSSGIHVDAEAVQATDEASGDDSVEEE